MSGRPGRRVRTRALALGHGSDGPRDEWLATEEPLEIRVSGGGQRATVAVTMRTPGDDFDLAVGFLHGEGIVRAPSDVRGVRYCVDRSVAEEQRFNVVTVDLAGPLPDLGSAHRHGTITSACGVCGKTSLDALDLRGIAPIPPGRPVARDQLDALPRRLRAAQEVFDATGGLHAAALFDVDGALLAVREDVGRHNALDKLLGWALLDGRLPLGDNVVLVSGRASFELAQKCAAAGVGVLAAISAPSSLAVAVADRFGMTLVGFLRDGRANVYSAPARVALAPQRTSYQ